MDARGDIVRSGSCKGDRGTGSSIEWLCTKGGHTRSSLCNLCVLCASLLLRRNNHRDTEHTEVAQRRSRIETFRAKPYRVLLIAKQIVHCHCPTWRSGFSFSDLASTIN